MPINGLKQHHCCHTISILLTLTNGLVALLTRRAHGVQPRAYWMLASASTDAASVAFCRQGLHLLLSETSVPQPLGELQGIEHDS